MIEEPIRRPARPRSYSPVPAPVPVAGCEDCAVHQRVIVAVDTDPPALVDARVLLRRHLDRDHR